MSLRVDPAFFDLLTGSHARLVGAPLIRPDQPGMTAGQQVEEGGIDAQAHRHSPPER